MIIMYLFSKYGPSADFIRGRKRRHYEVITESSIKRILALFNTALPGNRYIEGLQIGIYRS